MFYSFILFTIFSVQAQATICTYQKYTYNIYTKKMSGPIKVQKAAKDITPFERDTKSGCTVCEEDQVNIKLLNGIKFKLCHKLAAKVESTLNVLLISGVEIDSVEGYIVKQTAGDIDQLGNRTKFSQHAYGISIDINRDHNGLYDHCLNWSDECTLIHGGIWNPQKKKSISSSSPIYHSLIGLGLKWGGEIAGRQKDFMHFSPSGY